MSKNRVKFQCPICDEWHEVEQMEHSCQARCYKFSDDGASYENFQLTKQTLDGLLFTLDLLDIDRAYCDEIVWGKNPHTITTKYASAQMLVGDEVILYKLDFVNNKYIAYVLDYDWESNWGCIGKFKTLAEAKRTCQKHFDNLKKGNK